MGRTPRLPEPYLRLLDASSPRPQSFHDRASSPAILVWKSKSIPPLSPSSTPIGTRDTDRNPHCRDEIRRPWCQVFSEGGGSTPRHPRKAARLKANCRDRGRVRGPAPKSAPAGHVSDQATGFMLLVA